MSELILQGIDFFLKTTKLDGAVYVDTGIAKTAFLLLGLLLLFLGSKIYTFLTSFIMFWGVSIALCTVLKGHAGWRMIVTAFVILGCLLAYASFKWKTADAILFSAMAAAYAAYRLNQDWRAALPAAIAAGAAAGFCAQEAALASTVTIGAFLIYEAGMKNIVLFIACGFLFQLLLFFRTSERGKRIWKRFFVRSSST